MRGLTLIELLVAMTLLAILSGVGLPALMNLVRDYRATVAINQLVAQVQFARSAALSYRTTVSLCPGAGPGCGRRNTWAEGAILFIDSNGNRRLDTGEQVLRRFPGLGSGAVITWRSFGNRSALSINRHGLTRWQNGSFRYCPANGDVRFARQAIINTQARVRHARDRDGDGVREDPSGRPLRC